MKMVTLPKKQMVQKKKKKKACYFYTYLCNCTLYLNEPSGKKMLSVKCQIVADIHQEQR